MDRRRGGGDLPSASRKFWRWRGPAPRSGRPDRRGRTRPRPPGPSRTRLPPLPAPSARRPVSPMPPPPLEMVTTHSYESPRRPLPPPPPRPLPPVVVPPSPPWSPPSSAPTPTSSSLLFWDSMERARIGDGPRRPCSPRAAPGAFRVGGRGGACGRVFVRTGPGTAFAVGVIVHRSQLVR